MKITKRQLKRIIREEKQKLVKEAFSEEPQSTENEKLMLDILDIVDYTLKNGVSAAALANEFRAIADDLESEPPVTYEPMNT